MLARPWFFVKLYWVLIFTIILKMFWLFGICRGSVLAEPLFRTNTFTYNLL